MQITAIGMAVDNQDRVYPPFVLGKPRFDQSTFQGRLRHFVDIVDPRTLFTSERKLESSVQLLRDFEKGLVPSGTTNRQLWEAQKIKQSILHPDTDKKIFMPFRMSGYVPFGLVTVVGLLLPNQTLTQVAFWQWLNQSHNACVNYANRNASKETPASRFLKGYTGAVSAALGIALSLNVLLLKAESFSPTKRMIVQRFIPFPATAAASSINAFLMRKHELKEGIEVLDAEGKVVGTSQVAAKNAVRDTVITRMILPAPILAIPPLVMAALERTAFLKASPRLHLPIQVVVCAVSFGLALPVCIALFPQISKISVEELEPQFQQLTSQKYLFYNKGL